MEALTVTGPARNLLEFGRSVRHHAEPIQLEVVTYRRPHHPASDPFIVAAQQAEIPCHVLTEQGPFDPHLVSRIRELVKEVRPDIVQTHNNKSHFLMRRSGIARQIPWVAFHHGYTTPTRRQQVYNLLDRWSLRKAWHVVTVTRQFLPELARSGVPADRVTTVGNSIRADWMAQGARKPRSGGPLHLVSVGRLSREKAHTDLITAAAILFRGGLACKVTLVGDGHEKDALAAQAATAGLMVEFAGQVNDVRPYLSVADIFVLPSLSEGSPNSLLEAMSAGFPIVATNVGGIPETVEDGVEALLVAPAQPDALAGAIERFAKDDSLAQRLGRAARRRIERDFSPEARTEKLVAFYQNIGRKPTSVWR